jgi:hypothetical protein
MIPCIESSSGFGLLVQKPCLLNGSFIAIRTITVRKPCVGVLADRCFNVLLYTLVIPNSLALGANGKKGLKHFDLGQGFTQLVYHFFLTIKCMLQGRY